MITPCGRRWISTNPAYHGAELRLATLAPLHRRFCASRGHHFRHDVVSLRDPKQSDLSLAGGCRQLTDVHLLGLARQMGGCLATFDTTIPVRAMIGAKPDTLQVIGP